MSVVYVNTHMNIHIILQNTPRVYHQVLQQTDIIIIYNITTGYIPGTCQYTHNDLSEYSRLFIIVCNTCCIHYIYRVYVMSIVPYYICHASNVINCRILSNVEHYYVHYTLHICTMVVQCTTIDYGGTMYNVHCTILVKIQC